MPSPRRADGRLDPGLVLLVLGLILLGLGMLYSASAIFAEAKTHDAAFFLKKQAMWSLIGVISMLAFSRLDYNRLQEWIKPSMFIVWVLLIAVLFTPAVAGAKRWLRFGPAGIQPAELAKLTVVLYLASYLDRKRSRATKLIEGVAIPLSILTLTLGLIALEPDLGTPLIIFTVGVLLLFVGGARPAHLLGLGVAAVPVLIWQLHKYPYRMARLASFMSPWNDPHGRSYQLVQSLIAVGSGGWWGNGIGSSKLKLLFLPAPHTDFIFPIICEELGLVGSLGIVVLFALFLRRGLKVAREAPNLFGTLLAAGITWTISLQAFFNIAVSTGLLPTKGLPLPFFSFGGSSTVVSLTAVGVLLNISRQGRPTFEQA